MTIYDLLTAPITEEEKRNTIFSRVRSKSRDRINEVQGLLNNERTRVDKVNKKEETKLEMQKFKSMAEKFGMALPNDNPNLEDLEENLEEEEEEIMTGYSSGIGPGSRQKIKRKFPKSKEDLEQEKPLFDKLAERFNVARSNMRGQFMRGEGENDLTNDGE